MACLASHVWRVVVFFGAFCAIWETLGWRTGLAHDFAVAMPVFLLMAIVLIYTAATLIFIARALTNHLGKGRSWF